MQERTERRMPMEQIHLIGNAHIDPVWLWTWREGLHEIKATFRSALDRMNETPGYVFTCACCSYYEWVEENAPDMFEEIRLRIREGRWKVVGGMWVQPDMNTPSGESIARHLLYSQRYFREKFGLTVKSGYNVDTFGHNGQLPQLLTLAGIVNYVWMRPMIHENADIPEGALRWEGIDGTAVRAFRIPDVYAGENIVEKIELSLSLCEKAGLPMMCFYGVGNHGGGPTKRCLSEIEAWREVNGKERVVYSSPDVYFDALNNKELLVWKGELQHHASGCYSTAANTKMLHRRVENELLSAEAFHVLADAKGVGVNNDRASFDRAWKKLMFNQFHDLLGGCSIREALDDMVTELSAALSDASHAENAALQRLSWNVDTMCQNKAHIRSKEGHFWRWFMPGEKTPVVVFNPHSFEAEGLVHVLSEITGAFDDEGKEVPCQTVRAKRTNGSDKWDSVFSVRIPAFGYRLYWVASDGEKAPQPDTGLKVSGFTMENRYIRVSVCEKTGEIASLFVKEGAYEALRAPTRFELYDVEACDTWAHNVFVFDKSVGVFSDAEVTVLENGPCRAVIRAKSRLYSSVLVRDYILEENAKNIKVSAKIDTYEKHRLAKVVLPVYAENMKVVSEIPFGAIERDQKGEEDPIQRWTLGAGSKGGCAILNTGAYSMSAFGNEIRLTVLNTSAFADHYGQTERDGSMEYMQMGETRFSYSLYPYAGAWQNSEVVRQAALLNEPVKWVVETYHEGALGAKSEGVFIEKGNIMMRCVKRAENGQGYVVRLFEAVGRETRTDVDFRFAGISGTLTFRPYEIKTLYLADGKDARMKEIDIPEFGADE